MEITQKIAEELNVRPSQVNAAVTLLDEGATVPFIARYRKEMTGDLDDTQLRNLQERLIYLRELEARREVILNSIAEQDKLTPELEASIKAADTKARLEDLYLPYKPKRRTKAQIAREAGLAPLAELLWTTPDTDPDKAAEDFINPDKEVPDVKAALDGARQILMEQFAEDAELLGRLRDYVWEDGVLTSKVMTGKEEEGAKFSDYFEYDEPIKVIPSHRALALFRGRNESILMLNLTEKDAPETGPSRGEGMVAKHVGIQDQGRAADKWLTDTVRWTWKLKLQPHLEVESLLKLREAAEAEAIRVFAENLRDLLLAAPAGERAVMGLDPGFRTGVKVAIIDRTGKLLDHGAIYPHPPQKQWDESIAILAILAQKHNVELVSVGNGTASRETDKLVSELIKQHPKLKLQKLMVSEAGASVYSASEFAAKEFPDLDVSIRGAVSIARRLQDPLAELVKIEPKSIGVGQYQHDVNQGRLSQGLEAVVEDCVNAVGVDLNTASSSLLARVSGLNTTLADNIVAHRDQHGAFKSRNQLKDVSRLGPKTFEQAAGFLRIRDGENPLDMSSVHPEAYPIVERIAAKTGRDISKLIGDSILLRQLKAEEFTDDRFGLPTVTDILKELDKPGRDPRPEFKTAEFQDGVETMADLKEGMVLEGVVTNVTNFGAFVDIGVHQDGLVHISELADRFVKDPREVVKTGDVVKVRVMEVDIKRKRIALSRKLQKTPESRAGGTNKQAQQAPKSDNRNRPPKREKRPSQQPQGAMGGAMADAFARAKRD